MHIAAHRAETDAADRLAALPRHVRLEQLRRRRHAARCDEHLRHKGAVGRKVLAEQVHAAHEPVGKNLLRVMPRVERLGAQLQHALLLSAHERRRDAREHVALRLLRLGRGRGLCRRCVHAPARHGRQVHIRHVQHRVVFVDRLIKICVHVRIDRARKTVGDRRDIVSAGAVAPQHVTRIGEDVLGCGVLAVDGRAEAAHEREPAVEMPLQRGDVVFRQDALPDLNADLGHIIHDRHEIGVGMVDGDDTARADVAIKAAVRLFEEFPPHLRLHEQGVFRAPVVMREDDIRLQIVDQHAHIRQAVLGDVVDERVHLVRMCIEVRERILKAHEKVALLKDARSHEARQQVVRTAGSARLSTAGLPSLRAGSLQIGSMDRLAPARDIRAHGKPLARVRHRAGGILGKQDRRAPAVLARRAALAVAAQVGVARVGKAHVQCLILAQLALGLAVGSDELEEDLFRCGHGFHSLLYKTQDVYVMVRAP